MQGVRRGLFSNEAGEGSAPNAAATADVSHPVKQGFVQALGVFADTLVVCTCTAAIILLAGFEDFGEGGIVLTSRAMAAHLGSFGAWFLMAAVVLFAYSTIISNYVYGETGVRFLTKSRMAVVAYRVISAGAVLSGGFVTLDQAWSAVDLTMGVMVVMNVATLWLLRNDVKRLYADYMKQRTAGQDPVFDPSTLPERADILDGWKKI
jgi:AGCS family alanine or glycine:cation symporter